MIPDFTYRLLALAKLPFEKIVGTPFGIMALRVLKAYPLEELLSEQVWDDTLLGQLTSENLCQVLLYVAKLGQLDEQQFVAKVETLRTAKVRDDAMTLAEHLILKGEKRGLEKGSWVGRIQSLQGWLGQPETPLQTLQQQSLEELQVLHDELKKAVRLPGRD